MRFSGRGGRAPGEVAAIILASTLQLARRRALALSLLLLSVGHGPGRGLAQRAASGGDAGVRLVEGRGAG